MPELSNFGEWLWLEEIALALAERDGRPSSAGPDIGDASELLNESRRRRRRPSSVSRHLEARLPVFACAP